MKLFVYSSLDEPLRSFLRNALPDSIQPVFKVELSGSKALEAFAAADIIMGNPPVKWFEQMPPKLAFWQLDSAGFNQYQNLSLKTQVANVGDFYAKPCAETMVGGILAFYRGLPLLVKCQEQKRWLGSKIRPNLDLLSHKKVVILGSGTIGQAIKQMLTGFGCAVIMTARQNPEAQIYSFDALLQALPATDLVINTLPGNLDKYVATTFFQAMQPGSLYASVGRGNTTDEQALIQALQSGKIAGAVLDVTEQEPLPETSPLWEMENVILTQHTGGGFREEAAGKVNLFLRNLHKYLAGEPIENQINLSQGY